MEYLQRIARTRRQLIADVEGSEPETAGILLAHIDELGQAPEPALQAGTVALQRRLRPMIFPILRPQALFINPFITVSGSAQPYCRKG